MPQEGTAAEQKQIIDDLLAKGVDGIAISLVDPANETDLVNKRITSEMLRRQQEILTRLLEADKADKERGEKPERESTTAKEQARKMPPTLEEYLKQKQAEVDWYKTVPPSLKPYYKSLAEKYFKSIAVVN